MQWTTDHIIEATNGRLLYGPPEACFSTVGIDSRTVAEDHLFVAICGERHDGHTFLTQVIEKGVRGLLVQTGSALSFGMPNGRRWV